jgi:hypothetical protein
MNVIQKEVQIRAINTLPGGSIFQDPSLNLFYITNTADSRIIIEEYTDKVIATRLDNGDITPFGCMEMVNYYPHARLSLE